ncbi:MAG: phosphatase PAP2 family protein [Thermoleophilia bacterium]|nr:phosphatase PAP2 family protein [Thermoleophilia bacterium]
MTRTAPARRRTPRRAAGGRAAAPRRAGPAVRRLARAARAGAAAVGTPRREVAIAAAAYGLYSLVRGLSGGRMEAGLRNARRVVRLEQALGIHVEPALQDVFTRRRLGMPAWSVFYVASQVVVLPLTLIDAYHRHRRDYAFVRNMALLSWGAGVGWYALQPTAPPRLARLGVDDAVSRHFIDLDHPLVRAFYNPVAAMPSLHVGMSPVVAWSLGRHAHPGVRALGVAYPALVSVCVVVTGNHFLLDIAGGLAVVLPAAAAARRLARPPGPTAGTPAAAAARTTG